MRSKNRMNLWKKVRYIIIVCSYYFTHILFDSFIAIFEAMYRKSRTAQMEYSTNFGKNINCTIDYVFSVT